MTKISLRTILIYLIAILYTVFVSILFIDDIVSSYNLLINPIFWIALFGLSLYLFKDSKTRIKLKKDKVQTIFIIILMYLIFYFLSGLFFGYSRSPYAHSIIGIIKNLWSFVIIIFFQEYVRHILANNCSKRKLFYVLTTILFILIEINFYNFENNFVSGESGFKYISSILLPIIVRNILFTYLTLECGFEAVLAYRMPIMFANIILPIFPDLNWFIIALYELVLPFVCFIVINYMHTKKQERISRRRIRKQNPIKNVPFILVLFLFVGFVAGFFKYMPIAVMSNSMSNVINRGDMVVVEKLSKKEVKNLKKQDIIEYNLDGDVIIHRIIEVQKQKDGSVRFITMGDNNTAPDNKPVKQDQVMGKVKFKVSYIGYPVVYLNDFFQKTKPDVEMGK
ncbi:MAG: signal peptidase I [Lactobacillales bacterium]|nr:signal peptidase I [Lactobacillales bacterium]